MATGRAWFSLRYAVTRVMEAEKLVSHELRSGKLSSAGEVFNRALEEVQRPLTTVIGFAGEAMVPTFNANLPANTAGEKLLVRTFPLPASSSFWVGDVVAVSNPDQPARMLVRRVAAVEGDEMESSDPADTPFDIPEGHCWVLCDNPKSEASDSRKFGPVPVSSIIGRAIYSCQSDHDHGLVVNSEEAREADAAVLEGELDLTSLLSGEPGEEKGEEGEGPSGGVQGPVRKE